MGLFDKLKGALNAVTGGGAKVTYTLEKDVLYPGESARITITATSTGAELKSKGVFVDLKADEEVHYKDPESKEKISHSVTAIDSKIQIDGPFVLAPNESKTFTGEFVMPVGFPPSFAGQIASVTCYVRARIEAFGNDPDSGYVPVKVGSR